MIQAWRTMRVHWRDIRLAKTRVIVEVRANETPAALAPIVNAVAQNAGTPQHRAAVRPGHSRLRTDGLSLADFSAERRGDWRNTVTSVAGRRNDLNDLGIDMGIIFPDHFLLHATIKQADYAVALARLQPMVGGCVVG